MTDNQEEDTSLEKLIIHFSILQQEDFTTCDTEKMEELCKSFHNLMDICSEKHLLNIKELPESLLLLFNLVLPDLPEDFFNKVEETCIWPKNFRQLLMNIFRSRNIDSNARHLAFSLSCHLINKIGLEFPLLEPIFAEILLNLASIELKLAFYDPSTLPRFDIWNSCLLICQSFLTQISLEKPNFDDEKAKKAAALISDEKLMKFFQILMDLVKCSMEFVSKVDENVDEKIELDEIFTDLLHEFICSYLIHGFAHLDWCKVEKFLIIDLKILSKNYSKKYSILMVLFAIMNERSEQSISGELKLEIGNFLHEKLKNDSKFEESSKTDFDRQDAKAMLCWINGK